MSFELLSEFAGGALVLERDGEIGLLTLNRPERRNALNSAMWRGLAEASQLAEADANIRVLVVKGAGGHLAAGADIAEFGAVAASRKSADVFASDVHDGVGALMRLAKPTLAMIEGYCVGGGVAVALACDIRLAADSAQMGVTPAKLGLVYNIRDTRLLVDAVGPSMARDLLFTGRLVAADEATKIGLADFLHPADQLADAVMAKAHAIAANSQFSVRRIKVMVATALSGQESDDGATRDTTLEAFMGPHFAEGRAAFLAKRPAVFPKD